MIRNNYFLRAFLLVVTLSVAVAGIPASGAEVEPPTRLGSVAEGAPFTPDAARAAVVLDRVRLIRHIEQIDLAIDELSSRKPSLVALGALSSERETLQGELAALPLAELAAVTEPFNIDVGIFPVDTLRKQLFNDWNYPRSGGRRHQGTDVLAHWGVPLRAIEDSTVDRVGVSSLGGRSVHLTGKSGAHYYYAHLDEFAVEEGDTLLAGELVGTVGDSGNARGAPHLHIQIDFEGGSNWTNPYFMLEALFGEQEEPAPAVDSAPIRTS